tara:strand:+ start:198 stop:383 length:186 start_codon:yes stop_codon:yes gene_type:complete
MNREQLTEALLNALIGSVPVIFFIGVATFAVQCSQADASPEATVTIVDSEIVIVDANSVKE